MTLTVLGAVAGIGLGWSLLKALQAYGPTELKRLDRAGLDLPVLAYTLGLTLVTGLLLGLAPALTASRRALNDAMRDGGRGASPSRRANRLREAFTVVEVALALVLLAGAGLLLKSFSRLMAVDPGFRAEHVLTANLSLPGDRYKDERGVQFFTELGRRVRSLPGVVNASNITFLPFRGMGSGTYYFRADRPRPAPGQEEVTDVRMVQPGYFETMNIPLRQGRTFSDAENDPKGPLRFVISESLARAMYPGDEDPIGRQLIVQMGRENPPGEIIGVVRDIKHGGLDAQNRPMVYYPQSHLFFNFGTLVVQTSAEPMALAKAVTGVIHEMDPELAVAEVGTMQRWIDESVARPKFQMRLLAGFAALALVLALMGIYGVMSYAVEQRTHEIGVRMALGAQRGDVSRMILARGARMAAIGLAVGIAGALVLGKYLETLSIRSEAGGSRGHCGSGGTAAGGGARGVLRAGAPGFERGSAVVVAVRIGRKEDAMLIKPSRRRVIAILGSLPVTLTAGSGLAKLPETDPTVEGPFYKAGAPFRDDLVEPGFGGTPLVLSGRILNTSGEPVAGGTLDLWQANMEGEYDRQGYTLRGRVKAQRPGDVPGAVTGAEGLSGGRRVSDCACSCEGRGSGAFAGHDRVVCAGRPSQLRRLRDAAVASNGFAAGAGGQDRDLRLRAAPCLANYWAPRGWAARTT